VHSALQSPQRPPTAQREAITVKTRYFIVSALICSVFAVYFLYYHAWLSSLRRWAPDPTGQIDLLGQMASVAMAGAIVSLAFAVFAAVLRGYRRKKMT
jgi:hypothetical protein